VKHHKFWGPFGPREENEYATIWFSQPKIVVNHGSTRPMVADVVDTGGIEPPASCMSSRRSTPELSVQVMLVFIFVYYPKWASVYDNLDTQNEDWTGSCWLYLRRCDQRPKKSAYRAMCRPPSDNPGLNNGSRLVQLDIAEMIDSIPRV
jgi:hypothetical protein